MFLNNLQVSPARSDLGLAYSVVRPDGTLRPAYVVIKEMMSTPGTVP